MIPHSKWGRPLEACIVLEITKNVINIVGRVIDPKSPSLWKRSLCFLDLETFLCVCLDGHSVIIPDYSPRLELFSSNVYLASSLCIVGV